MGGWGRGAEHVLAPVVGVGVSHCSTTISTRISREMISASVPTPARGPRVGLPCARVRARVIANGVPVMVSLWCLRPAEGVKASCIRARCVCVGPRAARCGCGDADAALLPHPHDGKMEAGAEG